MDGKIGKAGLLSLPKCPVEAWRLLLRLGSWQRASDAPAEFAEDCIPPLQEARAFGLVERAVSVEGDGVAVVGGVRRAGDEEDACGRSVLRRELERMAGEGDDGVAGGCHDFADLAGLWVVGDCPNAAREDVSDLLEGEVGVDAVDVAGLDVAFR